MPRKTAPKADPPPAVRLTDAECERLAAVMLKQGGNVYAVARRLFPAALALDDADFDRLARIGGAYRCETCSGWFTRAEMANG